MKKTEKIPETVSLRLNKETQWLYKRLTQEKKKYNRSSISNTIQDILIKHFKEPE